MTVSKNHMWVGSKIMTPLCKRCIKATVLQKYGFNKTHNMYFTIPNITAKFLGIRTRNKKIIAEKHPKKVRSETLKP